MSLEVFLDLSMQIQIFPGTDTVPVDPVRTGAIVGGKWEPVGEKKSPIIGYEPKLSFFTFKPSEVCVHASL